MNRPSPLTVVLISLVAVVPLLFGPNRAVAYSPVDLTIDSVVKVGDAAPHNAFTDLIRFQDYWYLSFREADSHAVSGDGDVRVLRSADGGIWESVALLDWGPEYDMRDAKLNITPDGRLMLNTAAAPLAATDQRQSLVYFSPNGTDWSDGPYEVGEPDWWLWGVGVGPDDKIYGVGYGDIKTHPRTTRLYRSADGINYETIVPTLTDAPETGETALVFRQDGTAVALVRQNDGSNQSWLGTASADYTDWDFQSITPRIGGPELIELPDGTILAAGRAYTPVQQTAIWQIDPEHGQMNELIRLPSGGDTSYPGMVWHEDQLWMSYYSSHEGKTSIYLAKLSVTEPEPPPPAGTVRFQEDVAPSPFNIMDVAHIRTDTDQNESDLMIVGETADHVKTLRGVLGFDLSVLPEGARVGSISLTLVADRDSADCVDAPFELALCAIEGECYESEVTWTHRAPDDPWTNPGGDFDAEPLAVLSANPSKALSDGPSYTWESTPEFVAAAQAAVDAGTKLCLLLRTPDGETQDGRVVFYFESDDSGDPAKNPLLEVSYTTLPGDLNCDGTVGSADLDIVRGHWGEAVPPGMLSLGDADGDGVVGSGDLDVVRASWGNGMVSAVPEPSAFLVGLVGCGLVVRGRWGGRSIRRESRTD